MAPRLRLALVVAILFVASCATGAVVSISSAQETATSSTTCTQEVTHSTLMTQEAIAAVNETGKATSTIDNTRVTVEESSGFVRLRADNPNGYCVAYVVEISPEIVPAADLGNIESNEGGRQASWRAVQDLASGSVHTRVEFTLEGGESATFAPSTVRVKSLSWTGEAKRQSSTITSRLKNLWGTPDLEKRKYEIEPTESSDSITVPLEDGRGGKVDEWLATYEVDGQSKPVTQDAQAPVYYTESSGSVTFHFNDKGATVHFVAEPNFLDEAGHSVGSYWSGVTELGDWIPLTVETGRVA